MKAPPSWVRWVLVFPVAFAIDMLAQSATHSLTSLLVPKSLEPFINFLSWQVLGSLAFVAGGVLIAPKYKYAASIVLGAFKVAIMIFNIYIENILIAGGVMSRIVCNLV